MPRAKVANSKCQPKDRRPKENEPFCEDGKERREMKAHPGNFCCYKKDRAIPKKQSPKPTFKKITESFMDYRFKTHPDSDNFRSPRDDYPNEYKECGSVPWGLESPRYRVLFDSWVDAKAKRFSLAGDPYKSGAEIRVIENFADGGCLFFTLAEASFRAHAKGYTARAFTALELKQYMCDFIREGDHLEFAKGEIAADLIRKGYDGNSIQESLSVEQVCNYFTRTAGGGRWGTDFELGAILRRLNACAYIIHTERDHRKPRHILYKTIQIQDPDFTFIILWNGSHYELGCIRPLGTGATVPFETVWRHCGAPKFLERLYKVTPPFNEYGACVCAADPVTLDGIEVGDADSFYSETASSDSSSSSVDLYSILPPELVEAVKAGLMTKGEALKEHKGSRRSRGSRRSQRSRGSHSSESPFGNLQTILPPELVMAVEQKIMSIGQALKEHHEASTGGSSVSSASSSYTSLSSLPKRSRSRGSRSRSRGSRSRSRGSRSR